ncbi:histone-lysine N-methyltransferase EHMT2-like isoform X2 [Patiria miniata]|uniref:Histone-lysine N-methyltransferase EHMT1 n=1 Tax=Patiria miniata TaxID=46514 RepID=A0A914AIE8_PATMI|nr:histone-lysine N-methyltransferase EHMT2-like isoform X2 [Patiria miniata]
MAADWKTVQKRSTRKQFQDLSFKNSGQRGVERVFVNRDRQSQKGRESQNAWRTPRQGDVERGVRNSVQGDKPSSKKTEAGDAEQAPVMSQQQGVVRNAGEPVHRTAARKTGPSAATSKKAQLVKQLMKSPSKLTARKTGPNANRLPLPKGKVHFNARKRAALPVRFDFRRSSQGEVPKRHFAARKSCPVEGENISSHSHDVQLADEKFSMTILKLEPVQNGLPSNEELKGSTTDQPTETPKRHITARKSCPTPKNPAYKATNPEGSHKKPHQVRFANQRSGKRTANQDKKLNFDLDKSRKRNAAAVAETSPVTKKLKSASLVIPPVIQRAIMLGLATTSSFRPGMKAGIPVDADTILSERHTQPLVHKSSPQTNTSNDAKTGLEKSAPDIRHSAFEDQVEKMKQSGARDTNVMESPGSSQVDDQDVFMDDDPPKLISSRDLEAQDMSGSDETPELDNQPPPDITSAEPMHQTLPPSGELQSTDRDNPTPIPGTTASSCNPRHALAADFPVGAAGSATPDSSATETCPSDVIKKKKRPRTHTHFGMKRHRVGRGANKLNSYDSDSTDVLSEAGSEIQPPGQNKKRSSSSSTVASLESEVDYLAQGNLVEHNSSNHHLQSELPLCCCRMEQKGPSSIILSTCRALEVIDSELVECKNKINTGKLHRPSSRVPYGAFCSDHRTLMTEHKCCPGCGCFCTTGVVVVCNPEGDDKKSHHFHRECIMDLAGALYCPHCGNTAGLREISIPSNGNMATLRKIPKSMILSGVVRLPKSLLGKLTGCRDDEKSVETEVKENGEKESAEHGPRAKMSITKMDKPEPLTEEEGYADLPSKSMTLKSGTTLTSKPLPPGPKRDVLEAVMEYLNADSPKRSRFIPKSMYAAAAQGEMGKVLQMLAEGFDPNYRFPAHNQETALHPAAAAGHLEIIVMLLQAGANMEAEDEDHKTPLHMAVENGHNDSMRYLIKHGAVVQHKDDEGMTILHLAAKNGNFEAVKFIMSLRKIYSNAQDDGGWTPIIWAAEYKHIPVVKYLIERGADPNIRDKEGNSGLHWAVFSGTEDVAEIFLNRHSDVHAPNIHGDTPLHIASRENNYGCVTMLLLRNANIAVTNQEEETPLDCAKPNSDVALALQVNEKMKLATGNRAIRTEKIISRDIARGLEALPITVVNAVNDDPIPTDFHYVAKSCETKPLNINHSIKNPPMCTCTNGDCASDGCECANNSVQCWYDSDCRLFPDFDYHEPPLIFECGPGCKCWRTCRNRVVQNGIRCHLQLYRTAKIGWGVRVTQDVPQGTFICEYAGELISDAEADKREDDSYLFDLDNEEREVYCIDARYYGNISRFINHQCDPNIVPVRVFIEHRDISFPRIAFFASRDIKAQEELGFDYGDKFWAIKSKFFTCCCGSVHCKHAEATSGSSEEGEQES